MNTYARWAVAAIAIVIAVGGAAYFLAPAGGQVGGPPAAIPSPTSSPSVRASATAQAATSLPSPSRAILADGGDVFPGTYIPRFDPPMTFTIDKEVEHNCAPGFRCRGSIDVNLPAWLGLEFGQPAMEVNVIRVDKVIDAARSGNLIDPPKDLATWILSRPGLTVITPPKAVTVGGLAGTQFDVRTGSKDVALGPITGVTDIGAGLPANSSVRVIVVTVDGHQITIALLGPDPFTTSMLELQPLVDSIVWR